MHNSFSTSSLLLKNIPSIKIDSNSCISCKKCMNDCPSLVFNFDTKEKKIFVENEGNCIDCGHCVAVCDQNSIIHSTFPEEKMKKMTKIQPFLEKLKKEEIILNGKNLNILMNECRRSVRQYDSKRKLEKNEIEEIYEIIKNGATGTNAESTNVLIINNKELLDKIELQIIEPAYKVGKKLMKTESMLKKIIGEPNFNLFSGYFKILDKFLNEKDKDTPGLIFRGAPSIVVTFTEKKGLGSLEVIDGSLAIRNVELWALTKNLGTCHVGFLLLASKIMKKKILPLMGLDPKKHVLSGAIMIGKPKVKYLMGIPRKERKFIVKE